MHKIEEFCGQTSSLVNCVNRTGWLYHIRNRKVQGAEPKFLIQNLPETASLYDFSFIQVPYCNLVLKWETQYSIDSI